jgi:flagellar protein FlaG
LEGSACFKKGWNFMGIEINNAVAGAGGTTALRPSAPTPASANPAIQLPDSPKVQAPKPVDIHFDASEVRQSLQEAVNMLNQQIKSGGRGLGFYMDEALNGPVVTVRSTETGEVVRQIPNEVVVSVAHNIERMKGLLFSAKA